VVLAGFKRNIYYSRVKVDTHIHQKRSKARSDSLDSAWEAFFVAQLMVQKSVETTHELR